MEIPNTLFLILVVSLTTTFVVTIDELRELQALIEETDKLRPSILANMNSNCN